MSSPARRDGSRERSVTRSGQQVTVRRQLAPGCNPEVGSGFGRDCSPGFRPQSATHGGVESRSRSRRDRARFELTRLRLVVILVVVLGLIQVLYEDVVLFLATTRGGVSGLLSSRLVAIGIPLTIAALLILILVGGALWVDDGPGTAPTDGTVEQPADGAEGDRVGDAEDATGEPDGLGSNDQRE